MRLLRSFRDVYDGCQRADLEPTPLYVRKRTEEWILPGNFARREVFGSLTSALHKARPMLFSPEGRRGRHAWVEFYPGLWVVCGEATPFWYRRSSSDTFPLCLSLPEMAAADDPGNESMWASEPFRAPYPLGNTPGQALLWLEEGPRKVSAELHRMVGVPVFSLCVRPVQPGRSAYRNRVDDQSLLLVGNPSFQESGMARLADPATLWQRIDTYLGNEMAVQVDPLPLADVYRRDAHGFDATSFKQPAPGEKKARRRARVRAG